MPGKQPIEVPATLATQVHLAVSNDGWRISFGEAISTDESSYHTAIFLPTTTALQVVNLFNEQAKNAAKDQAGG